jgi:hypothetical protein
MVFSRGSFVKATPVDAHGQGVKSLAQDEKQSTNRHPE